MILLDLLNYFLGMICFAGSVFAFIFAGFYFGEKDFWNIILGVIISVFGIILFSLFLIAFFTI